MNLLGGVYSVLLPGLGQLYQHRVGRSAFHFLLFAAFAAYGPTQRYLPVIAMASGAEAYRAAGTESPQPTLRTTLFAAAGLVGFLAWFGLAVGRWIL
ncbi:MAG: hypothetical protein HYR96_06675 [Deltaproteobacteria bacterium]|nr:hypothetical protein [Deltaproteobacteria bacterium]MBI3296454.1 hypothetical protein [Deltaproteobacteria bacterium]